MVLNEQNLKKALEQPLRHGVYYYYSTEEYLVRSYAAKTLALLAKQEDDAEVTRVEGPAPSIEEAVAAAGTISFFGTKRIVELPMLEPSAMNEADVGADGRTCKARASGRKAVCCGKSPGAGSGFVPGRCV